MPLISVNILTALVILSASISPTLAQTINPPTTPQIAPMSSGEQQNLDLLLKWWREVLEARHTELAEKFQAELHPAQSQCSDRTPGVREVFQQPGASGESDTKRVGPSSSGKGSQGRFCLANLRASGQGSARSSKEVLLQQLRNSACRTEKYRSTGIRQRRCLDRLSLSHRLLHLHPNGTQVRTQRNKIRMWH